MLSKIKSLRTNENILIAIDALFHAKHFFFSIFLMTFMIRSSLNDSPVEYIVYLIFTYIIMATLAVALVFFIKKHILTAWRIGIFMSMAQVLAIIFFHSAPFFIHILAILSGVQAALYWRPQTFLMITEVSNARRFRFESIKHTVSSIVKIIIPVVLALFITEIGYIEVSILVFVAASFQFFASILLRPVNNITTKTQKLYLIMCRLKRNKLAFKNILLLQALRGFAVGSTALIAPAVILYNETNSDLNMGFYTSLSAAIFIIIIPIYNKLRSTKCFSIARASLILLPALILPLLAMLWSSLVVIIIFFLFMRVIVDLLMNMVIIIKIKNSIRDLVSNDYILEAESISEVALNIGRIAALTALLVLISLTGLAYLPIFIAVCSLAIIPILKFTKST